MNLSAVRSRPIVRRVTAVLAVAATGAALAVVTPAAAAPAAPTVTSLSTHSVPFWAGVPITIRGTAFVNVQRVLFGGQSSYGFRVDSPTQITAWEPEHALGQVHVQVVTSSGTSRVGPANLLTYRQATLNDPVNGGWSINQSTVVSNRMMATAAARKAVPVAPNAASWNVDLGTSAVRRAQAWMGMPYSFAGGNTTTPTKGVCDTSQGSGGALDCHLVGFDCSGLVMYAWGPYRSLPHFAATQYQVAGAFHPTTSQLMPGDLMFFGSPSEGIGHVMIYTGRGGTIEARESGFPVMASTVKERVAYGYMGATRPKSVGRQGNIPSIVAVRNQVSTDGGWLILSAHYLTGMASINLGGTLLYDAHTVGVGLLAVKMPAHPAGRVPLSISNAWGTSQTVNVTYAPPAPPTVASLSPATGSTAGGTPVTIRGTGFSGVTQVMFGGYPATAVKILSDTAMTVVAPKRPNALPVGIRVSTKYTTVLAKPLYTYTPATPLTLTSLTPASGRKVGGTAVTLRGSGFTGTTSVMFGGYPATAVKVIDDSTMNVVAPARPNALPVGIRIYSGSGYLLGTPLYTYVN